MSLFPELQAKPMGQLVPGELVRCKFRRTMILGMAVGCDFLQLSSGMVFLPFEDFPDRPGSLLRFFLVAEADLSEPALSYGSAHCVVVDPAARVVSRYDERFAVNGALVVGAGARTVRSGPMLEGWQSVTLMIDVDAWNAVPRLNEVPGRLAVLDWQLRLLPDGRIEPPLPPAFIFAAIG